MRRRHCRRCRKPIGPRLPRRRVRPPFPFVDPRPIVALDIGSRSSAGAARPFGGRQRVQTAGAPAGGVERGGALLGLRLRCRRAAVRFEVTHPLGDGIGVALARLPAPDPVVDHDAAMLAFPLLGDLRQPQAGAAERGCLPRIGVHLADDQVPMRVVGVVVRDHDREVVFEAERAQAAVGELELLAADRGLTGRPRRGEVRTVCKCRKSGDVLSSAAP